MNEDFLLFLVFAAGFVIWFTMLLKAKPKQKTRSTNQMKNEYKGSLNLPRKNFSNKENIDFSVRYDHEGNRLVSFSNEDLETLKSNILGRHPPEQASQHLAEIEHLFKKRDWILDEFQKTYEQSDDVREKYDALEISEKLAIFSTKRGFESEFSEMLKMYSDFKTSETLNLKASERSLSILQSEIHLLEIIREYWWKLNTLSQCFELSEWITQAEEIRSRFYFEYAKHIEEWGSLTGVENNREE